MKVTPLKIEGVSLFVPEIHRDNRGFFHRSYCQKELEKVGIIFDVKQGNISENSDKYTLRGFHYQVSPTQESKVITCVRGSIYNVVLDVRRGSNSWGQWTAAEICSRGKQSIYVPAGCANAFLTLSESTVVHYYMGDFFNPETYRGIRYDDPTFKVEWPHSPKVISDKDLAYSDFQED